MTDHVDALLNRLRADVPPMSDDAFDAGRARLAAATEPRDAVIIRLPVPQQRVSPTKRPSPWLVAAMVVLAAVAAAVVVMRDDLAQPAEPPPVIRDEGGLPPLPPAPLNAAGDLAAVVSELVVPPGQYLYLRMDIGSGGEQTTSEMWLPAEAGQEMMVRDTPPGGPPKEVRSTREAHRDEPPLEATPAAQYRAMRARLGTALDAPERARDELLVPLTSPLVGVAERKLRLATIGLLPKIDIRHERMQDGRLATVISAAEYSGISRTEYFFDSATGHVMQTRTVVKIRVEDPRFGYENTTRYSQPVVVPSIGAVP